MAREAKCNLMLTELDWQFWFEVNGVEAARLIGVQGALLEAGVCSCPETVIGMSRSVLHEPSSSAKLRILADVWDRAPLEPVRAEPTWPPFDGPHPVLEATTSRCRRRP